MQTKLFRSQAQAEDLAVGFRRRAAAATSSLFTSPPTLPRALPVPPPCASISIVVAAMPATTASHVQQKLVSAARNTNAALNCCASLRDV